MNKLKQQFVSDLIADHGNSLERFLTRKLDNPSDAAEIAQEAYLRIYRLQQPETLDNARAFLFQVASNLAVDHLRRRTLHYRFLKSEEGQGEEAGSQDPNASGASPEKILAARERLALIYASIDELPLKCRQAFLLSRNSGLSYTAIARELDVSVSSVEKYILQALKHCRAALARQDGAGNPAAVIKRP
ncbi:sigma-70 family RNA polymerase sigma factor [Halieaceae bacterium IMCC14734]|uniref:Sigma-70 family RNA polymerase sigma factor n=1 Tax=Candidatus Litorirhabdus singularis TaxID=2518993 RepID=A0ABT3TCQ4_9GAMM|nr:sigma-70 family RNA polymerase sigma factor [Candidatus Litorirhabdus singularis]MCX2980066.1 sigma-70 family RNA polymerase sigma factor [Candidatus Litorirhabdus singularis]